MAICLPGMASRVKRAATSATRPAPLVMTTNWMTMIIRNTTSPTTTDPPMTKWPNAATTLPPLACSSTWRVTLTLSARRYMVATSSSDGKTEKSSARLTYIDVSRITTAPTRLRVIRRSMSCVGNGTTNMTTTHTIAVGTPTNVKRLLRNRSSPRSRPSPGPSFGSVRPCSVGRWRRFLLTMLAGYFSTGFLSAAEAPV